MLLYSLHTALVERTRLGLLRGLLTSVSFYVVSVESTSVGETHLGFLTPSNFVSTRGFGESKSHQTTHRQLLVLGTTNNCMTRERESRMDYCLRRRTVGTVNESGY